jgi:hypothetical protein
MATTICWVGEREQYFEKVVQEAKTENHGVEQHENTNEQSSPPFINHPVIL